MCHVLCPRGEALAAAGWAMEPWRGAARQILQLGADGIPAINVLSHWPVDYGKGVACEQLN